jgi:hypothetical protein
MNIFTRGTLVTLVTLVTLAAEVVRAWGREGDMDIRERILRVREVRDRWTGGGWGRGAGIIDGLDSSSSPCGAHTRQLIRS